MKPERIVLIENLLGMSKFLTLSHLIPCPLFPPLSLSSIFPLIPSSVDLPLPFPLYFFHSSIQHVSWWTRGSSLWSHLQAVQQQVPCSPWQMQCTFPIYSSREMGMVLPALLVSSTPALTERATPWLHVHLFVSMTSYSRLSQNCTGRSSSSSMRVTMVSWVKCVLYMSHLYMRKSWLQMFKTIFNVRGRLDCYWSKAI